MQKRLFHLFLKQPFLLVTQFVAYLMNVTNEHIDHVDVILEQVGSHTRLSSPLPNRLSKDRVEKERISS